MKKRHPLRRVMLGTAATVSGVVLLLALKQPADGSASAAAQAPASSGPAAAASPSQNAQDALGGEGAQKDSGPAGSSVPSSGSLASKTASAAPKPSATKSSGASGSTGSGSGSGSGSTGSGSSGSGASSAAKTVTGNAVDAQYGAVQVKLTVKDGKVTAAEAVQGPTTGPGGSAIPTLNKEVVTAQSATIDSVSGASFTSEGYKKSLQSAIDKAGL
ncbi:FMN-binding protein [Streptomyces sp.]